jgi:hypothetical protein
MTSAGVDGRVAPVSQLPVGPGERPAGDQVPRLQQPCPPARTRLLRESDQGVEHDDGEDDHAVLQFSQRQGEPAGGQQRPDQRRAHLIDQELEGRGSGGLRQAVRAEARQAHARVGFRQALGACAQLGRDLGCRGWRAKAGGSWRDGRHARLRVHPSSLRPRLRTNPRARPHERAELRAACGKLRIDLTDAPGSHAYRLPVAS